MTAPLRKSILEPTLQSRKNYMAGVMLGVQPIPVLATIVMVIPDCCLPQSFIPTYSWQFTIRVLLACLDINDLLIVAWTGISQNSKFTVLCKL